MTRLHHVTAAVATRLRQLSHQPDRGDSPIPSTVIIIGMAVLAVGLLVALGAYVSDLLDSAPTIPDQNF